MKYRRKSYKRKSRTLYKKARRIPKYGSSRGGIRL